MLHPLARQPTKTAATDDSGHKKPRRNHDTIRPAGQRVVHNEVGYADWRCKDKHILVMVIVEKGMDGFSVIELRDASLSVSDLRKEPDEARKRLYRQILRFVRNGWLQSEGEGRDKRYPG